MAVQPVVYYVWQLTDAQRAAISGTPWDGAAAATPAPDQALGGQPRNPYRIRYRDVFQVGTAAYDQSGPVATPDSSGSVAESPYRNAYRPWPALRVALGAAAFDESSFCEPLGNQPRPIFEIVYNSRRAQRYAGIAAYDDSFAVAPQPDTTAASPRNSYRQPYTSQRATTALLGRSAFDDSVVTPPGTGVYIPVIRRRRR